MSITNLGFCVCHGQKILSHGYDTEEEAIQAALRIAKTENYAFEYKGLFLDKWRTHKLAKNWKRLRIRRGVDWGGAITYTATATISRKQAEQAKAKPYEAASNVKHLRRPKELKATFCRGGEIFKFKEAFIERGYGLEIIYEGQETIEALQEWINSQPQEIREKLGPATQPSKTIYHISSAEEADKWKEAGLSAGVYKSIEAKAKQ